MTKNDFNLIKAGLRRAFSRSDLRKEVLDRSRISYTDDARPRVTKWSICENCKKKTPTYLIDVDHREPVIPVDTLLGEYSEASHIVLDRLFNCSVDKLQNLCEECHNTKTQSENKLRREFKKSLKEAPCKKVRKRRLSRK